MPKLHPIPGHPKYQITKCGRVFSLHRKRYLSSYVGMTGYVYIGLVVPPKRQSTLPLHRLLAAAFIPNPNRLAQINHRNGKKADNRLANLEWVSAKENIRHAHRTGLCAVSKGSAHYRSKLTDADVKNIRRLRKTKSLGVVAKMYGVTKGCIQGVTDKRTWKHI